MSKQTFFFTLAVAGSLLMWPMVYPLQKTAFQEYARTHFGSIGQMRTPFFQDSEAGVSTPTSTFREDLARTGFQNSTLLNTIHLQKQWEIPLLGAEVHGASKSTPAVDESGVYLGTDSGWFHKFDLDGRKIWSIYTYQETRGIHSTAILSKDHVFIGNYDGRLYCLDKLTGKIIWQLKLGESFGASPTMVDGTIIATIEMATSRNAFFAGIDSKNGNILWLSEWLGEQSHSSPAISLTHRTGVAGANNGNMFAFDIDSGQMRWVLPFKNPIKSTPVIIEDKVYFTTWGKKLEAVDLLTGKSIQSMGIGSYAQSSPTYFPKNRRLVFMTSTPDSSVMAVDIDSWKKVWSDARPQKKIYTLGSALGLKDKTGNEIAIIGLAKELAIYDVKTGRILFSHPTDSHISGMPTFFADSLYTFSDKGILTRWK